MTTSVYRYYDDEGRLLYVGVTDRGVRRLHEHADSKPWWNLAASCQIKHFETRDEALAEEKRLIQTLRPLFNEQHHPDRGLPIAMRVGRVESHRRVRNQREFLASARSIGSLHPDALDVWESILRVAEKHERRLSRNECALVSKLSVCAAGQPIDGLSELEQRAYDSHLARIQESRLACDSSEEGAA